MEKIDTQKVKEVVELLHKNQRSISEIYKTRKDETEQFVALLKEAVKCNKQNRKAGYIESSDNYKSEYDSRRREVSKKVEELDSLTDWCRFIEEAVSNVKRYRVSANSYDTKPEDKQKQQEYLTYYATYLHALVSSLLVKDARADMQKFAAIIHEYNNELYGEVESRYVDSKKLAEEYLHTGSVSAEKNIVKPLAEEVQFPKEYPEKARLCLGKYSSKFDIENGNADGEREEFIYAETKEHIRELRDRLKECETQYKKLIYSLISANRGSEMFALDFSAVSENNHVAIHQPRYSETENKDKVIVEFIESAICRYMNLFPKTSKRIAVIQSRALSELAPFVQNITVENKYKELVFTADDKSDEVVSDNAEELLKALLYECRSTDAMLGMTECQNLFEYNRVNYKNGVWKQMTLLVIKDFPLGFNEQSLKIFKDILGKANKLGIYVIMTVCDDLVEEMKEKFKSLDLDGLLAYFGESFDLCVNSEGKYIGSMISRYSYEKVNFGEYSLKGETFRREKYFSDFEKQMLVADDPAIPLQSLFKNGISNPKIEQDDRRENFFRVLSFPVGKEGTKTYSVDLYQSGGGSPHMVIAGTTGSGKSVLLHDIILSAMCCYTPEELELYLFDFKETAEGFDVYENGFPHVKKVAMECKDKEIYELLTMIKDAYTSRMKFVKDFIEKNPEEQVTNIIEYNAYARKNGLKQIPRMIVIIDEYQTITSEANLALLLEIAQKGREYGVVLIMASQSSNVNSFGSIIKLFGHRFEFKNEPIGVLISKASSRAQELLGPKGLCFYSADGSSGTPVLIRCAFVNKRKDLPLLKEYIGKKYAAFPVNTYKIGSVKQILREAEYDKTDGFASLEKTERSGGKVFDGEIKSYNAWLIKAANKVNGNGNVQNAGYLLNLGLKSISLAPYKYTLEKNNPYMLIFGDSLRTDSVFYSVAKSAIEAAKSAEKPMDKPIVYYFNGNKTIPENSAMRALEYIVPAMSFSVTETSAAETIDKLYQEFLNRKADTNNVGTPIVIMVSEFISFIDLFNLEKESEVKADVSVTMDASAVKIMEQKYAGKHSDWLADIMPPQADGQSQEAAQQTSVQFVKAPKAQDGPSVAVKFNTLLSAEGGRFGFFFCLQVSDSSKNNYLRKYMEISKLNSVVYLDTYTGDDSETENKDISQISAFVNVFLPDRRAKIGVKDIKSNCGYLFKNEDTEEFIPYEYIIKK